MYRKGGCKGQTATAGGGGGCKGSCSHTLVSNRNCSSSLFVHRIHFNFDVWHKLLMAAVADTFGDTGGSPYRRDSSVTSGATGSTSMHFCSMCSRGHVNRGPCWNCKQQFLREYRLPYDPTADTQPSLRPPQRHTGRYENENENERWLQ